MKPIDINDLNLIKACRLAGSWARILPREIGADFVIEICRCWNAGDVQFLLNILGDFQYHLGTMEDADHAYQEIVAARAAIGGPGGEGCLPRGWII